jgi:hypothetical protein
MREEGVNMKQRINRVSCTVLFWLASWLTGLCRVMNALLAGYGQVGDHTQLQNGSIAA